jgi:peroxiredoxin
MPGKPLQVGDVAPDFTLKDENNNDVTLSSFKGKNNVILSFHPQASTSLCTAQMTLLHLAADSLKNRFDTVPLGISVDAQPSKRAWAAAMGISRVPLLSDFHPQGAVAELYGVHRPEGFSERAVFVVDKQGIIRFAKVYPIRDLPKPEDVIPVLEEINKK